MYMDILSFLVHIAKFSFKEKFYSINDFLYSYSVYLVSYEQTFEYDQKNPLPLFILL